MGKDFAFKKEFSFEERFAKASKMREKYPDRVPVIVEKAARADMPDMEKKKFLVPVDFTVGQFLYIIRQRLHVGPGQALFVFVGNALPPNSALVASIYKDYADKDGFLYMQYSGEKTFG